MFAAAFGALIGLTAGCAYLGGSVARTSEIRSQAVKIQGVSAAGFSEEALAAAAGGLNESALTIARRHDPYTVAGDAQRDRQAVLIAARLESLRGSGRANPLSGVEGVSPFRLASALDSSRDLECLTQAVYYEARGEGSDGMKAVAQVVLNRARHPAFPKSICAVVFQGSNRATGCQFSFTCSGIMNRRVNQAAWNRARKVATAALDGSVYSGVGSATHFHTTSVSPGWRNSLVRVNQVGSHVFYRFGGRRGSSATFSYAAEPSGAAEPRMVMASLDPTEAVRQAGQAVAYTAVLAREGLTTEDVPAETAAPASTPRPTAQKPAAQPAPPQPAAEEAR